MLPENERNSKNNQLNSSEVDINNGLAAFAGGNFFEKNKNTVHMLA